jgi:TonB family protein
VRLAGLAPLILAIPAGAGGQPRELIPVFEAGRSDYPADWTFSRRGLVELRFELLPTGRIGECRILRSSVANELEARSCRLLSERARFVPERDRVGRARSSRHDAYFNWPGPHSEFGGAISVNQVIWFRSRDYPRGGRERSVEGRVVMSYEITEQGRLENCQAAESSGSAEFDQAVCRAYVEHGRFLPARGASDQPRRTTGRTGFRLRMD